MPRVGPTSGPRQKTRHKKKRGRFRPRFLKNTVSFRGRTTSCRPCRPCRRRRGIAGASASLLSVTSTHSVVRSIDWRSRRRSAAPTRATFAGSRMPALSMSLVLRPVASVDSRQRPCQFLDALADHDRALAAGVGGTSWRSGSSTARSTIADAGGLVARCRLRGPSRASAARMQGHAAARRRCPPPRRRGSRASASSTRSFFSFISTSVAAPT